MYMYVTRLHVRAHLLPAGLFEPLNACMYIVHARYACMPAWLACMNASVHACMRASMQDVHDRFEELAREGKIPVSTLAMRKLCKKSLTVIAMGVQPELVMARDHGYIHPYMHPPKGLEWRVAGSKGKAWKLVPRGG